MNHYECLKVTPDAPTEVIRAAYRALAGKSHPDRQGGGTQGSDDVTHIQMVAINAAYEVLINPELRAEYDAMLAAKTKTKSADGGGKSQDAGERGDGFSETRIDIDWMTPKPVGPTPLWPLTGSRRYIAVVAGVLLVIYLIWVTWQVVARHQMDKALSDQYEARAPLSATQDEDEGPVADALVAAPSTPHRSAQAAQTTEVPATPEEVLAANDKASSASSKPQVPPPSFERQPTVTELSKLSDEQLMAILPSLGELQPAKGSFSRQVATTTHHPLDGKPLNLRADRQLVDPLAPESLKH